MHAEPGDWLIAKGTTVGAPDEIAQIREVRGDDGGPPYLVVRLHDGHEALVFPGPDAHIVTAAGMSELDTQERKRIAELQETIAHRDGP
ncbi:DUF1918 domain-containing protein [Prescottella subtropica]|uniref:DUF1918 domain-containing protein n=1 Tax=Prescottella subtropica TaxID=2545757 RepID=UPI0010F7AD4B|nr:DUF1918 domain-containing protein [Prescottella subtropica]